MKRRGGRRARSRNSARKSTFSSNKITTMMEKTVTVPSTFVAVATYTASSAPQYFTLLQSAGTTVPRLIDMMNDYQFYRITALKITLLPVSGGGATWAIGYESSITNTAPSTATFTDVTQLGANRVITSAQTSPTSLVIPTTQLNARPGRWIITGPSTVGTMLNQGYIILVPNAVVTTTVYVRFEVVCEFKSPVVSFSVLEEKNKLVKKLENLETTSDIPKFSFATPLPIKSPTSSVGLIS